MLWLIQLLFPLALLLWLSLWPAHHVFLRATQITGTAAILLALHLAGLWMMPPWWTPWILWALFAIVLWRARSVEHHPRFGGLDYVFAIFWAALAGVGGWVAVDALRAQTPPAGKTAMLAMPLPEGRYYVASGGSREMVNAHLRTLGRNTARQRSYWGQSYGVDIVALDRWGMHANGIAPHGPGDHRIFGTPVLAPCAGRVVHVRDGAADDGPVNMADTTSMVGNHALLRCGEFDILLAHFRKDSLWVGPGDTVREGQIIGAVGNSGASDMPHLHIHAQRPGTLAGPFSGEPVPMRITGRYLVRGDWP